MSISPSTVFVGSDICSGTCCRPTPTRRFCEDEPDRGATLSAINERCARQQPLISSQSAPVQKKRKISYAEKSETIANVRPVDGSEQKIQLGNCLDQTAQPEHSDPMKKTSIEVQLIGSNREVNTLRPEQTKASSVFADVIWTRTPPPAPLPERLSTPELPELESDMFCACCERKEKRSIGKAAIGPL
ncbi:MAG: hypothetical protein M1837_001933 [Sclerophora amabilis]|nr:MAG: hypothetical protein M1837_001933 [Sclerophora amabilis]